MGRNYDIITGGRGCGGTLVDFLTGRDGEPGKSAYEIALDNGFRGSVYDWICSLHGRDGKSAFELAKENGFCGSLQDWICSLKGDDAYQTALKHGFCGSYDDWVCSLRGENAYELAKQMGFCGTLDDYLMSIKGDSSYEIALKYGYEGSEEQWIYELTDKAISSVEATGVDTVESNDFIKFTPQVLSKKEQEQARLNLGLEGMYCGVEAIDADDSIAAIEEALITDAVRYTKLRKTEELIKQAQQNLKVADISRTQKLEILVANLLNKITELENKIASLEQQ